MLSFARHTLGTLARKSIDDIESVLRMAKSHREIKERERKIDRKSE